MAASFTDPKLLCRPEEKAELEASNGVEQLDYITYLVNELKVTDVRESYVRELKRLAIKAIYPCEDQYRNAIMHVRIHGSAHEIPHESQVPSLVIDLVDFVNDRRREALERAAYSLWRLNWIHPFAGGNGRTARALAYLIVCIENGATLPGVPSMPALVAQRRDEYVECLVAADRSEKGGKLDLSEMTSFLREVLTQQLESAVAKFGLKITPS